MATDFDLMGTGGETPLQRVLANLLFARACTSLDDAAAELRMNTVNPAGTTNGWKLCTEGNKAPVQCADDPTRRHLMFEC